MYEKSGTIYSEKTCIAPLKEGKHVFVRGIGNSMTPILKSGQIITMRPLRDDEPNKGDVVIAKVNGRVYCHKVTAIKKSGAINLYQISNNHGHVNGWTTRLNIYGVWDKDLDLAPARTTSRTFRPVL